MIANVRETGPAGSHRAPEGGLSTMEIMTLEWERRARAAARLPLPPADWWAQMAVATIAAGAVTALVTGGLLALVEWVIL